MQFCPLILLETGAREDAQLTGGHVTRSGGKSSAMATAGGKPRHHSTCSRRGLLREESQDTTAHEHSHGPRAAPDGLHTPSARFVHGPSGASLQALVLTRGQELVSAAGAAPGGPRGAGPWRQRRPPS